MMVDTPYGEYDPEKPAVGGAQVFLGAHEAAKHMTEALAKWVDDEVLPHVTYLASIGTDPRELLAMVAKLLRDTADQLDPPPR
jgi:hypothetical protein